jgi:formamidopyrimidine-DNA glycosylase
MPELPEVETIRRGLAAIVEGARIEKVVLNRPDLRFPFPPGFVKRLTGQTITATGRRAKYLLLALSSSETWLSHLGMTGGYRFTDGALAEPSRLRPAANVPSHDHVIVDLTTADGKHRQLIYADSRRFGFMDLYAEPDACRFLAGLGPEPIGNAFSAAWLAARWAGKRAPVKAALLDQRHVAGLGNIYVSEALHRAGIHPKCPVGKLVTSKRVPRQELEALVAAIRNVLAEAIAAGGSTLRDYRNAGGGEGYFQHRFTVYGRAGEPCLKPSCAGSIERLVQSGRSSFYCPRCQYFGRPKSG